MNEFTGKTENEIILKIINITSSNIIFVWVPRHFHNGNEFADKIAADETVVTRIDENCESFDLTATDFKTAVNNHMNDQLIRSWWSKTNNKYRCVYWMIDYFPAWNISKKEQMVINRVRSGHSYITHDYLISKEDAPVCNYCQQMLSIQRCLL